MEIKLSQDLNGNLKVNGKRVGELINGLFRMTTDSLTEWRGDSRQRFKDLMAEHGKSREAEAIIKAAGYYHHIPDTKPQLWERAAVFLCLPVNFNFRF